MTKFFNLALIIFNVALAVSGQLAIKAGMKQIGVIHASNFFSLLLASLTNVFVLLGLLAYVVAAGTWIVVLSRIDLSVAYPMLSLGYVAILVLSALLLKESVGLVRVLGTVLIIAGVVLIYRS